MSPQPCGPDWAWGQESRSWETSLARSFSAEPGMCPREAWTRPFAVSKTQLGLSKMRFLLPGCVEGPGLTWIHIVSSLPLSSFTHAPIYTPTHGSIALLPSVHSLVFPFIYSFFHAAIHSPNYSSNYHLTIHPSNRPSIITHTHLLTHPSAR